MHEEIFFLTSPIHTYLLYVEKKTHRYFYSIVWGGASQHLCQGLFAFISPGSFHHHLLEKTFHTSTEKAPPPFGTTHTHYSYTDSANSKCRTTTVLPEKQTKLSIRSFV